MSRCIPTGKATHLISDEDMGKLFRQLDKIEAEGLENYVIPLAIRLQFEFAGRRWRNRDARSNGIGSIWKTAASSGPTARPAACPSP
jgi:hypothetical protein